MSTEEEIKYDKSLLNKESYIGEFNITREMIDSFCKSTEETNPLFTNEEHANNSEYIGIIAPPTLCNIFMSKVTRPDIKIEFGDGTFFAGQALDNVNPIKPGDKLTVNTRLKEVFAKTGRSGKMIFEVWETKFANQDGLTTTLVRESFVHRKRS